MGGCCGAMKTGQKSLPDKKKSADSNQEKPNGKEATHVAVSANDTGKASVDGGEALGEEKPQNIEDQASEQIAAPGKISISHVEPVQDTTEPPVQATENIMDLETAVAPFESLPSSGDQSQQEAQGSITSAEPEVLLPFQIPVQHTFTTSTTTTVRHEETHEEFKLRVEEPQLDAAFPGGVQLSITENVQAQPIEEAPVPADVEILSKSFATAEVEAAPESLPVSDVEILSKSFATSEVEATPETLPASDVEPAPKATIAVCPPNLSDIPYVHADTVEQSKSAEEVTPVDLPEAEGAPETVPASDVALLAKSFAATEVEAAPEPVPAEKVEAGVDEAVTRVESATLEAQLPLEEDLPPPPPVEAPQLEELEAGGRFEVDASLPVPAPLELPSEPEPAPEAIIAVCPLNLSDIPYVHTVEQPKGVEEVTPVDLPEPFSQEQVSVDIGAQIVVDEPTAVQESVQSEPEHVQESAPVPVQEPSSFEEAAVSVQVPSQEVAPAEEPHSQEQVPVELGLGSKPEEEPLIQAQDDLPPPVVEEPTKHDSVLESYEAIDAPAEHLPQPPVEEAVGSAVLVLPSFAEKEQLSEHDLVNDGEQPVVAFQEPSQPEPAAVREIEAEVSKQVVTEVVAPSAVEAPEDTSQVQQVEVLPPAVSQELIEEVPAQVTQEVSQSEEQPRVEQQFVSQELIEEVPAQETQVVSQPEEQPRVEQQLGSFEGVAEEQLAVVQPVSSEPVVHQEPVDAEPQEKVESVSSEQVEQEGKVSETEQSAEVNVDEKSAEIVVADAPLELGQRTAEETASYFEQQPQEPATQQEEHHEEPAPYQEQQIEVPAPYHEQQPNEPTSQQEQQAQESAPYQDLQPEESASQPEQQLQEPASQEISGTVEETDDAVQSSLQEQEQSQETSEPRPVLEVVSEQVQQSRDTWWNESGKEQNGQQTTTDDVPVLELVSEQVREAHQIWWDQSGAPAEAAQPEESVPVLELVSEQVREAHQIWWDQSGAPAEAAQPEESVTSLSETIQPPTEQESSIEEPSSIPSSETKPEETAPIQTEETVSPIADGSLPEVTSEPVSSSSDAVDNQQEAEILPETKELPIVESPLSADGSSTVPTENGEVEVSTQSSDETSVSNLSPEGIDPSAAAAAAAAASTKEPILTQA